MHQAAVQNNANNIASLSLSLMVKEQALQHAGHRPVTMTV